MEISVNLRHLEREEVVLEGELPVEKLDVDARDEVITLHKPLRYTIAVQHLEQSLLLEGRLRLALECYCVRCLKPFEYIIDLNPWRCHVPLEGEDAAPVNNDCVDLTPYAREDILLEFPQHPLCKPECRGLSSKTISSVKKTGDSVDSEAGSSPWSELNKLKF